MNDKYEIKSSTDDEWHGYNLEATSTKWLKDAFAASSNWTEIEAKDDTGYWFRIRKIAKCKHESYVYTTSSLYHNDRLHQKLSSSYRCSDCGVESPLLRTLREI